MRRITNRAAIVMLVLEILLAILLAILMPERAANADALYVTTVTDMCNVRESPSKDSKDLGDLHAGESVTGTGYKNGWVQVAVSFELTTGWVRADMLTLADPDHQAGKYTNASGGRANIRTEPGGDHVDWLEAGKQVTVSRWLDVDGTQWAVTKKGYINGDCLEPATESKEDLG